MAWTRHPNAYQEPPLRANRRTLHGKAAGQGIIVTPISLKSAVLGREAARGTHAGGSHVHCHPINGLGTRLYPCGIATATPQTFTVASRPRRNRPSLKFPC